VEHPSWFLLPPQVAVYKFLSLDPGRKCHFLSTGQQVIIYISAEFHTVLKTDQRLSTLAWISHAVFALVYASISLVNHYLFRTSALDLGMFNHALWSYAHLKADLLTLNPWPPFVNSFGDHLDPILVLVSPLYYASGTYTLLLVQIASVIAGGAGIHSYARHTGLKQFPALLVLIHFYLFFGIYSALAFDFHVNVPAAMLVPWFILFLERRQLRPAFAVWLLMILCKENESLWAAFIVGAVVVKSRLRLLAEHPFFITSLFVLSVLYFFAAVQWIMPYFNGYAHSGPLRHFGYMGSSVTGILGSFFHDPLRYASLVFTNPLTGKPEAEKILFLCMLAATGGIALLVRPWYLLLLVPVLAQKMLSDDPAFWGMTRQYSIEFAPLVSMALAECIRLIRKPGLQTIVTSVFIALSAMVTAYTIERSADRVSTAFYSPVHYAAGIDVTQTYEVIKNIPHNAVISVATNLAPHLCDRDTIYHFPIVRSAGYIAVFTRQRSTYPLDAGEFTKELDARRVSGDYDVFYADSCLLVLRKR
jgi:uncharacterized membrane protein